MSTGEVDIWRIHLDAPTGSRRLFETLSADELRRLAALRSPRTRRRFVRAHAACRSILGGYLGRDPASVEIEPGRHGKPTLVGEGSGLAFNLSHAADLALLACTREGSVGIDVEREPAPTDAAVVATQFFGPTERRALDQAAEGLRSRSFLSIWTAKEAYVKALGIGLSYPLDEFEVTVGRDGRIDVDDRTARSETWSLWLIEPLASFVGAIAISARTIRPAWRDWQDTA